MPGQRLPMRQVREVLRLTHVCGHSGHQIAAMVGVSRYTVAEYLRRAGVVGITWPVPDGLDDAALERRLFSPPFVAEPSRPQPDWPRLHAELRRPGVTLLLLWEEYRAGQPEGYGYSRFCDLHAAWRGRLSPTMRQTHPAGERLFVDYAGQTVDVIDGATGEVRAAQVFVAALGASNYTYAEARWTQALPDWIGCHVAAFTFFGGVARQIVCDNLKSGVTATCRYEPGISRTYQEMAGHYGTAVLPGRVRRPRDKAKVEVAVQVVQRWILARLRNQRFFSLAELNVAIRALTTDLNNRTMRHLGTSRRALFEVVEQPALLPLPSGPYAYAEWKRCRAGLDYHVEVQGHFYSVPYRLVREVIEARITVSTRRGPPGREPLATLKRWLSRRVRCGHGWRGGDHHWPGAAAALEHRGQVAAGSRDGGAWHPGPGRRGPPRRVREPAVHLAAAGAGWRAGCP